LSDNLKTVQAIYEAFGRGDIPAILATLADDVAWEHWDDNTAQREGVPWLQARRGPSGAAEFFGIIGPWTVHDVQVRSLLEGPGQVAAEFEIELEMPNGHRFRDQEMHLWTFDDVGKVVRFRHYTDTAKHIAAAASVTG
jgi:ketosteroid isomerase-like protein